MRSTNKNVHSIPKTHLAACLLTALALESVAGSASASPTTHFVTSCADDSTAGTLRAVIFDPATLDGDIVDVGQLQCSNSTITLQTGAITITRNDLTVQDSAVRSGGFRISGNHTNQVFRHSGSGTLSINNLYVAEGYVNSASQAFGGCIFSSGSVALSKSTVAHCTTQSDLNSAGGGIYAAGSVSLTKSVVAQNSAKSLGRASGGGVYGKNGFVAQSSTIQANAAYSLAGSSYDYGGGVFAKGVVNIKYSTFTYNVVGQIGNGNTGYGGGLYLPQTTSATITNSTIVSNVATKGGGLLSNRSLLLQNSTVALNQAKVSGGGVQVRNPGSNLTLQSSILGKNTVGLGTEDDLVLRYSATLSSSGTDNLVMASNVVAPPGVITVTADPNLGPTALNGGVTANLRPLAGSPAIGVGNNKANLPYDQRRFGYPRQDGMGKTDIGAVQYDPIFANGFE